MATIPPAVTPPSSERTNLSPFHVHSVMKDPKSKHLSPPDPDRPKTWGRHRAPRLAEIAYKQGHPVHVIICTLGRRPLFEAPRLARTVFRHLLDTLDPPVACLLPDHLHLLLESTTTMVPDIRSFKSISTRLAWTVGHRGKLWQRSYYDHVVRTSESLLAVAAYILGNAVEEGLVDDYRDYPYHVVHFDRLV